MTDKNSVADWSTTASENDNVGGVKLAENKMRPKDVNNAVRTVMAQVKTASTFWQGFDTVADLIADETLTYSNVAEGDVVEAQGFRYEVAADDASDEHLETAGGVKLYVLAGPSGFNWLAWGGDNGGVNDNFAAWEKLMTAPAFRASADIGRVYFPPGDYYFSETLELSKSVTFWASGDRYAPSARLLFAEDKTGIVSQTDYVDGIDDTTHINIEGGIWLDSKGGTTGHGIWIRSLRNRVVNSKITNFPEHGVRIAADNTVTAILGNANVFTLEAIRVESNGGDGVHVEGNNANSGVGISIDCVTNGGWGIQDASQLGNTWIACHTNGNVAGPYKGGGASARTTWIGCYSESNQSPSSMVNYRHVVIGGAHGAGINGEFTGYTWESVLRGARHSEIRSRQDSYWGTGGNSILKLNNYPVPRTWSTGAPASGGFYLLLTHDNAVLSGATGELRATFASSLNNGTTTIRFAFGRAMSSSRHFLATVESSTIESDGRFASAKFVTVDYDSKTWLALKVASSNADSDTTFGWYSFIMDAVLSNSVTSDQLAADVMKMIQLSEGANETVVASRARRTWMDHTLDVDSLFVRNLPTADPAVAGALWSDGGTVKVSTGA